MYTYKIKVIKTSGFLKESAGNMPKVLTYKSKYKLNERAVFNKASLHIRKKYGLVLEMADISPAAMEYEGKNHVPYWAAEALSPLDDDKIKHVIRAVSDNYEFCCTGDVMDELIDEYGPEVDCDEMEARINKCADELIATGEISEDSWSD